MNNLLYVRSLHLGKGYRVKNKKVEARLYLCGVKMIRDFQLGNSWRISFDSDIQSLLHNLKVGGYKLKEIND